MMRDIVTTVMVLSAMVAIDWSCNDKHKKFDKGDDL